MPIYEVEINGRTFEVDAPSLRAALTAAKRQAAPSTPPPEAATRGMVPPSTMEGDPSPGEQWPILSPAEKANAMLQWGGNVIAGMTGMGAAGREAVENPATTLTTSALGAAVPPMARAIPTRAKAGAKFERVMAEAKDVPVNPSAPGDVALNIYRATEHGGGSMPRPVMQFLRRVTDPTKPELNYEEAREWASNLSRLSADETRRLAPVVRRQLHELRETLNRAVGDAAGRVGRRGEYEAAMTEWRRASRGKEIATKVAKIMAGMVGAGAALKAGQAIID